MRILVIDQDRATLDAIGDALYARGHEPVFATSSSEVAQLCESECFDLALLGGPELASGRDDLARLIRQSAAGQFLPVIAVAERVDAELLEQIATTGCDDFVVKPIIPSLLQAKVATIGRIHRLFDEHHRQREQLENYRQVLDEEVQFARHIFEATTLRRGACKEEGLVSWNLPVGEFNGDLVVYDRTPGGELHILLGDFTGHGLAAAVGAPPAADIFYSMTRKGFGIAEIAAEMNAKLRAYLPMGRFLAAGLLSIDAGAREARVWNGGLPAILAVAEDGRVVARLKSRKVPLGILERDGFDPELECIPLDGIASLFLCSDGLIESRNAAREMFGEHRLETTLLRAAGAPDLVEPVREALTDFSGDVAPDDDISLLQVDCRRLATKTDACCLAAASRPARDESRVTWCLDATLSDVQLRQTDPRLLLATMLEQLDIGERDRNNLNVVVAELVNNAIDHGLLGLDSEMKSDPDGFARYYREREQRLAALDSGYLRIGLTGQMRGRDASVTIRVQDSGRGYSPAASAAATEPALTATHGRGLMIVRSLSRRLELLGNGNTVEAELPLGVAGAAVAAAPRC